MALDILEIHNFNPVTQMCENCRALYVGSTFRPDGYDDLVWQQDGRGGFNCRVCGMTFWRAADAELVQKRGRERAADMKELGEVAASLPPSVAPESLGVEPLASLFKAINAANWFIHFITYSIDSTILGALHMASQRVQVRGVIGTINDFNRDALAAMDGLSFENPKRPFAVVTSPTEKPREDGIHVKLLIIDGALALKGSANLTVSGYRKAGKDSRKDSVEAVSVPDTVARLNNSYFAEHWAKNTPDMSRDEALPF